MKAIINRMRWLFAGVSLALLIFGWLESESEENKKKADPYDFSNYKHNHTNKETVNV
jgi:hypothetical protein